MSRWPTAPPAGGTALVALLALAGCRGEEPLIPVEGQVTVGGKPLTTGTVVYHPDPAKGNKSLHEPRGELGPDGRYQLVTGTQAVGAPPGWYKVTVYAGVKINPQDPYSPEKSLTRPKYGDQNTSGLALEVRPEAPARAYDLKLEK